MKSDGDTTIQELQELVTKFAADRHWQRHHTPKNLTMNLVIEATELMEHYVWERGGDPDKEEVADELADVVFNILNFAEHENIDITKAFIKKYEKLLKKYPVELFHEGRDSLEDYHRIKKAYRIKKYEEQL